MVWDAIIVGARCAGSPLARFLAREGTRVLLIDAATFPSDQPLSTHFIHPFGMAILRELGLADRVFEVASPIRRMTQIVGGHAASFDISAAPGACPRRTDLDHILVEAARAAGAEVRLGVRVIDVLRDGERVVGVVTRDREGTRDELRARIVVGADGRHSTIADLVGAEKYFAYDAPRIAYWAYWPRPAWYEDAPYGGSTFVDFVGDRFLWSFPTARDQLILGVAAPAAERGRWRTDPASLLEAALGEHALFGALIRNAPRLSKVIGIIAGEYFFRRAAGPGWALVGDAGLFKDPTPGLGISDALRDARALSRAILDGSDAALERYWRQRDVDSFELYQFARDAGELTYNNPFNQLVFARVGKSRELQRRVIEIIDRERLPYDFLRPTEVLGVVLGALVRGKLGVVRPFLRAARRLGEVKQELERRRALLTPALPAPAVHVKQAA